MLQNNESNKQDNVAPWIIGILAVIVVGIATYMNYGNGFRSHAAPVETTTAPDNK